MQTNMKPIRCAHLQFSRLMKKWVYMTLVPMTDELDTVQGLTDANVWECCKLPFPEYKRVTPNHGSGFSDSPFPEYKKRVTPNHGSGFSDAVNWMKSLNINLLCQCSLQFVFFSAIAHCHCNGWYKHGCLFSSHVVEPTVYFLSFLAATFQWQPTHRCSLQTGSNFFTANFALNQPPAKLPPIPSFTSPHPATCLAKTQSFWGNRYRWHNARLFSLLSLLNFFSSLPLLLLGLHLGIL